MRGVVGWWGFTDYSDILVLEENGVVGLWRQVLFDLHSWSVDLQAS